VAQSGEGNKEKPFSAFLACARFHKGWVESGPSLPSLAQQLPALTIARSGAAAALSAQVEFFDTQTGASENAFYAPSATVLRKRAAPLSEIGCRGMQRRSDAHLRVRR
jgi:hypothetical protein